jgi:CheY-like chemotaxis protein
LPGRVERATLAGRGTRPAHGTRTKEPNVDTQPDRAGPSAAPVTVVTVDDQPFFRRAAHAVIAATGGFEVVGEAASADEAVRVVGRLAPELALVDVRMPDVDGLETTRRIKRAQPETVVVLVSIEDVSGLAAHAERCGAAALIQKQGFGPAVLRGLWAEHGGGG